ncbi:MAG: hypothetical protein K0S68_1131, partial [Candidatus Saccharibacteria bacterium]|nr:hypothetical protein [Candidatus Saccharibacteria bacterium]
MTTTTAIPETELTTEQRERAEKLERLESRRQLLLGRIKGDQALVDQIARAEPEAARRLASSLSPRAGEKEINKMTDALGKIEKVIDAFFAAIQQQREKAAKAQEKTKLAEAHTRRRQV